MLTEALGQANGNGIDTILEFKSEVKISKFSNHENYESLLSRLKLLSIFMIKTEYQYLHFESHNYVLK